MGKFDSLINLLIEELKALHNAETQLLMSLPRIAQGAASPELKSALKKHQEGTEGHAACLEKILHSFDESPGIRTCRVMQALIEEAEQILDQEGEAIVRDAAIIGAMQKIEHYEIAAYGTALSFAQSAHEDRMVAALKKILEEKFESDKQLSNVAKAINTGAEIP